MWLSYRTGSSEQGRDRDIRSGEEPDTPGAFGASIREMLVFMTRSRLQFYGKEGITRKEDADCIAVVSMCPQ